jgi:hypothetical protein
MPRPKTGQAWVHKGDTTRGISKKLPKLIQIVDNALLSPRVGEADFGRDLTGRMLLFASDKVVNPHLDSRSKIRETILRGACHRPFLYRLCDVANSRSLLKKSLWVGFLGTIAFQIGNIWTGWSVSASRNRHNVVLFQQADLL